jgi:DNA-binding NtrC family response regulator
MNTVVMTFDAAKPMKEARAEFEKAYFEFHFALAGPERGAKTRVAKTTGMERTAIYRKLRKLGVKG